MAHGQLQTAIHGLRRTVAPPGGGLTDTQLLERFVGWADEAAFEVLVWRHGPMVLSLCRSMLRHEQDTEDAFQATFLILVRKAGSIGKQQSLGSWLYKVAYRVALRLRAKVAKRPREVALVDAAIEPAQEVIWHDLRPALNEEIGRLPEKYRSPFVLCYLEGKTNQEAAHELGCPQGTISSRLGRAKALLRARLVRRGLALPGGLVAALTAHSATLGGVPAPLVNATTQAAVLIVAGKASAPGVVSLQVTALMKGVLKAMLVKKLVTAAVVTFLAMSIAGSGGVLIHRALAAKPSVLVAADKIQPATKPDNERIQGTWKVTSFKTLLPTAGAGAGAGINEEPFKRATWVFTADKIILRLDGKKTEFTYQIDTKKKPKAIDISPPPFGGKGKSAPGIYTLEGDILKICFGSPEAPRPTDFQARPMDFSFLVVLERGQVIKDKKGK